MSNPVAQWFDFTAQHVLVTGGTSGIGLAVAHAFRDAGAAVTVTGTRAGPGDYDVDLAGLGYRTFACADPQSATDLVASLDQLDVLVNNAGATFPGGLDEYDPAGFEASVQVNMMGAWRLTRAAHPLLKQAGARDGGGRVVSVASLAAVRGTDLVFGYSAAKAGLLALTRSLAMRWAGDNIRLNAVVPGMIRTAMTAPALGIPGWEQEQSALVPMGRFGEPHEVAGGVIFLASRAADYVTGEALVIDGGRTVL